MTGTPLTLVIMAAGVGSRFGGTKQLAEVGPCGEAIVDYTIADARAAGFDHVVVIVRSAIHEDMRDHLARFHADADGFAYVAQDLDPLAPPRARPWGTGHAVLSARDHVQGPFAVVNADDYYGPQPWQPLAEALRSGPNLQLVAYRLDQTLSDQGTVSRGVCSVGSDGYLEAVHEHPAIRRHADGSIRSDDTLVLDPDTPVSMNLWGLHASFFGPLREGFERFVADGAGDERAEYQLPSVIAGLITAGTATVEVRRTDASWMGVTYPGDLAVARARMTELIERGHYPSPLLAR
ncbi:MAG: NTP transferase domain-containing protein [Acidimicrobiia bacterium]|nr:NTP transferase domain-containing protein [Acidimicrobiia bacterium]